MPAPVVCGEPGWLRRFLPLGAALGALLPGLPLFLFLLPERGARVALLTAAGLGLLSAYLVLAHLLLRHRGAHRAEALRLGYAVRPLTSGLGPLSWLLRGLPLALAGTREARREELDLPLVRGFAPLADRCEAEDLTRQDLQNLATVSLILDGLLLPVYGLPFPLRTVLFAAAAAAAAVLALQTCRKVLPRYSADEGGGLGSSSGRFWSWPFYRLWLQRRRQRDESLLRRDFRLILRAAAGVRAGQLKLELGSGAGVLRGYAPERLRRGWMQTDRDPLALHWVRSRDAEARQVCADAAALPFKTGAFDRVLTLTFFDSVYPEQRDAALAEAFRALKPGGILLHVQDFSEWPGPALLERANVVLERAGCSARLKSGKPFSKDLLVPGLGPAERGRLLGTLRRMERSLLPAFADEVRWLRLALARACPGARRREDPRSAFLRILRRGLVRQGFEPLAPAPALEGALEYCVYLAARKPV